MPQAKDCNIEWAIDAARRLFGDYRPPGILRPRLIALPQDELLRPWFPPARLPLVTSIAEFHSTPAGDGSAFRSSAVVIWFQEHFGSPTDDHTVMQLRETDWQTLFQNADP